MLGKLCHHLMENGIMRYTPALRGGIYCHAHFRVHQRMCIRMRNQRRRQS